MKFTTKDLIAIFDGLKENTLHYWCEFGCVNPLINPGRGGKRLFDMEGALKVGILFHLMRFGFHRKLSMLIINNIHKYNGVFSFGKDPIINIKIDIDTIKQQLTSRLT